MRTVSSHLLEDKMDEAVTHYINSHQPVHVDGNSLALNVQDDNGSRVVTVMQPLSFSTTQMCRQVSTSDQVDGPWHEEFDPDGRLAAIVAHLSQPSRPSHNQSHKVSAVRNDVDTSVILDTPLRIYNGGQALEHTTEPIVVQVSQQLQPLPPLQEMKRCQEPDWFSSKTKGTLKDDSQMLTDQEGSVLDIAASASPVQNKQQSKKSLPHKKRISRKLKRNTGNSTPQQVNDVVVVHCNSQVGNEEILPDNFVNGVSHAEHLTTETHHITHEVNTMMRPILICQLCGEFYGEEQLKFFQHLKQHYEPHGTIIIENPVSDLGIDKMTNTCIVDNVPTLPDSLVELSLENTVPKSIYQSMDKHILYTSSDKTLTCHSNKVQYTIAGEKEIPQDDVKTDLYETLAKLDLYNCPKCDKTFRKQKQCEVHLKEAHSNPKLEDMGEFSEPEDLMEGIHVAVEDGEQYEPGLLPHLIVENGHVHQEHVRQWYMRNGETEMCGCGAPEYCAVCAAPSPPPAPPPPSAPPPSAPPPHPPLPPHPPHPPPPPPPAPAHMRHDHSPLHLKEEMLQRILDGDVANQEGSSFGETIIPDNGPIPEVVEPESTSDEKSDNRKKKPAKRFECPLCDRVFHHRNSLLYHMLMHGEKQHSCKDCDKGFYTAAALKIHRRVHSGDRPCACDQCGRTFRQWSDLKYHKASIHSDQKHFKCEFCNKEFARRYSLNVHRRIHTGERNYKCDYCSKTFRASSYRLSHMRTHTGTKPYKCTQCDKCFRVSYDLRRHMLIHEKVRMRVEEAKPKAKDGKEKKTQSKAEVKPLEDSKAKKAATARQPILRSMLDKKPPPKPRKPSTRRGAPNVTVASREQTQQFKAESGYTFDSRHFEYADVYKDGDRELVLRPMVRTNWPIDPLQRSEDDRDHAPDSTNHAPHHGSSANHGAHTINHSPHPTNHVPHTISHAPHPPNHMPATVTHSHPTNTHSPHVHSTENDSGFLERLSALYNITAV